MLEGLFDGCLCVKGGESDSNASVLPTCKGVVLFCDEHDAPVQLLITGDIRRLVRSRLWSDQSGTASRRADIGRVVGRVWYLCCHNDFRAALRHMQIARQVYGDSWREVVSLPVMWFVRINTAERWPNFAVTTKVKDDNGQRCFGPFAGRKSADRFVEALRIGFDLCRRPDIVDAPEKAASCPYLQMNTCPAPCVGNVERPEYVEQLACAVEAAEGALDRHIDRLGSLMREWAGQRRFEQANALKKRIKALEVLRKDEYRWTKDMSRLAILHIDRSARVAPDKGRRKTQTYAGFLITAGRVTELEDFVFADSELFCESLCDEMGRAGAVEGNVDETMPLAGYFLYRNAPPGIWLDCSEWGRDDARDGVLAEMVAKWGAVRDSEEKKEDACG